jgi:hypothetical protein
MRGFEAGRRTGEQLEARICQASPDEIQVVIDASTTTYLTLTRGDLLELLRHMDGERDAAARDRLIEDEELDETEDLGPDPFDMRRIG